MKKILLTGASSFLGYHLYQSKPDDWEIFGLYNTTPIEFNLSQKILLNLNETEKCINIILKIQPDAIIHTAAITSPDYCQNHQEESFTVNVTVTKNLAKICAKLQIPFVFTSTDLVFNGLSAPYNEDAKLTPVCIYGEQKAQAEKNTLEIYPEAVICRLPLLFGMTPMHHQTFLFNLIKKLHNNQKQKVFYDEFRSTVSGTCAAQGIYLALEKAKGIIHLGGKESISRFEFAELVCEIGKFDKNLLIPISQKDIKMKAPRPPDVSLNSLKAYSFGYNPNNVRNELIKILKII